MRAIRILLFLLAPLLLPRMAAAYGVHNNSGTSSEDSIVIAIMHLDSTGRSSATADSFFVAIFKSNTNDVIFRDSGTATMTGLDTMRTFGRNLYYYHRAIADIDGSGAVGQYEGIIIAKTNAGSGFLTPNRFSFQIMPADPRALIDSLFAVIDSIQNHESWRIRRSDTVQHVLNTVSMNNTDMGRVSDSVWNKSFTTSFPAGSMGDSLNNFTAYRAAAKAIFDSTATRAQIAGASADSVWAKPFATSFTAGSMGDSLNNSSYVQRILDDGITAAKIASNAISASEIEDNALTNSKFADDAINERVLASNAITLAEIDPTAAREIADSVWNKAFTTSFAAGSMGDSLNNATYVTGSGGGGGAVSDADAGKIADSVWNIAWGTSFPAGTMGDSINNFTPYRAASKAIFDSTQTAAVLGRISADSVWGKAFGTGWTAGSMGDSINNISYVGGASVFNTTQRDSLLSAARNVSFANKIWDADTSGHALSGSFGKVNNGQYWSQPIDFWNVGYSSGFTAGSMGDSLNSPSYTQGLTNGAITAAKLAASALSIINDSVWGNESRTLTSGGGGGNDSTSIARWVWNTPKANHSTSGTFGRYLDTEVSGLSSGSGAFGVTIVVLDTAIDQVVSNVDLAIRNLPQTSLIATGASSTLGVKTFNLNASSYVVTATAPGYSFATPDTIVVSGARTDTVVGLRFDPGAPAVLGTCRVYAYLANASGQPEVGATVSAYPVKGAVKAGDIVISPFTVQSTVESSGYFFIDLIWSSLLGSGGSQYEISISRKDGTILRKRVTVPDSTTWLLQW